MTSEGLGEMLEGDSADTRAVKFPLTSMGGRAEDLACADQGARTAIGVSGNFIVKMVDLLGRTFCLTFEIYLLSICYKFLCLNIVIVHRSVFLLLATRFIIAANYVRFCFEHPCYLISMNGLMVRCTDRTMGDLLD